MTDEKTITLAQYDAEQNENRIKIDARAQLRLLLADLTALAPYVLGAGSEPFDEAYKQIREAALTCAKVGYPA